ncbi:MAG: DUF2585 family protein [Pseudorhodoplanes sp.]
MTQSAHAAATRHRVVILSALILAILLAQAIALHALGHPAICTCGVVKLWHGIPNSSENSQHIADWYTLSHVIHGFLFYLVAWLLFPRSSVLLRLMLAVAVEAGWEIIENTDFVINRYRTGTIALNYYGDSIINSLFDTFAMMLGFVLAWRLPVAAIVGATIMLEAIPGFWIRDNLILNTIMLLHPFPAIRDWQAALL